MNRLIDLLDSRDRVHHGGIVSTGRSVRSPDYFRWELWLVVGDRTYRDRVQCGELVTDIEAIDPFPKGAR